MSEIRRTGEKASRANVIGSILADENHAVLTVKNDEDDSYMRSPCAECPWRKANAGSFPPEAFRISTKTATDMSSHTFGCHMSGADRPKTCAGFLLSETACHNLAYRLGRMKGWFEDVKGNAAELWSTYRKMAIANGVKPNERVLRECVPESKKMRRRR